MKWKISTKKIQGYYPLLKAIDKAVRELELYDRDGGYGDMAQVYETSDRESLSKELFEMLDIDLVLSKRRVK